MVRNTGYILAADDLFVPSYFYETLPQDWGDAVVSDDRHAGICISFQRYE